MGRGAYALARVAVLVRVAARWCWWLGVTAAVAGAFVPSLLGTWIGLPAGAAAFLIAAAVACLVRRGRYAALRGLRFAANARNLAALALTGHGKAAQLPRHRKPIPISVRQHE